VLHGGAAPAAQQAAKLRLLAMVEPVLATFEQILAIWHSTRCTGCGHVDEHGVKCVGCGKPTGDPMPVIRVGQLVLDRAGFHPTLTVEQVAPPNPYDDLTLDETIEKLEKMLADAITLRDAERAQLNAGAIDGVVDEGFDVPDDEPDPPIQNDVDPYPNGIRTRVLALKGPCP
jgi:hypothetical protein